MLTNKPFLIYTFGGVGKEDFQKQFSSPKMWGNVARKNKQEHLGQLNDPKTVLLEPFDFYNPVLWFIILANKLLG